MTGRRHKREITIVVVEDHDLCAEGVRRTLSGSHDMLIIEYLKERSRLLDVIMDKEPDVVLLDLIMDDACDVVNLLQRIKGLEERPYCIIVSAKFDAFIVEYAEELGISGYLLKNDDLSDLLPLAIRQVGNGVFAMSPGARDLHRNAQRGRQDYELSAEQYRVLSLLVAGDGVSQIAEKLGKASEEAVRSTIKRIRKKFGVATTVQAVVKAIREEIVPLK